MGWMPKRRRRSRGRTDAPVAEDVRLIGAVHFIVAVDVGHGIVAAPAPEDRREIGGVHDATDIGRAVRGALFGDGIAAIVGPAVVDLIRFVSADFGFLQCDIAPAEDESVLAIVVEAKIPLDTAAKVAKDRCMSFSHRGENSGITHHRDRESRIQIESTSGSQLPSGGMKASFLGSPSGAWWELPAVFRRNLNASPPSEDSAGPAGDNRPTKH